jgi:hypothetical protein
VVLAVAAARRSKPEEASQKKQARRSKPEEVRQQPAQAADKTSQTWRSCNTNAWSPCFFAATYDKH